ncbi:MAG: hypothetical protein F6K11_16555 [Leptolyngbya sp. SIO3F4]|nr:hypothetical protein [Leptolyngbya sp. SIO3F4]
MSFSQTILQQRIQQQHRQQLLHRLLSSVIGCTVLAVTLGNIASAKVIPIEPVLSSLEHSPDLSLLRPPVSLENGADITPIQGVVGYSRLTIDNGESRDAVVKLMDRASGETLRYVYVKAHSQVTLESLGTCECELKFATGVDWDIETQQFRKRQKLSAFSDPLEFIVEYRDDGEYWRTYTVTLHRVPDGTAAIEPIGKEEFGLSEKIPLEGV